MTANDAALRLVVSQKRADRHRAMTERPTETMRDATTADVLHLALGRDLPADVDPESLDDLGGDDAA